MRLKYGILIVFLVFSPHPRELRGKVVVHFVPLFTVPFSGVLFSTYHAMFLIGLRSSENATLTRVLTDFSRTFYTLFIYSIGNFIYSLVVAIGMYIRPQKFSILACTDLELKPKILK